MRSEGRVAAIAAGMVRLRPSRQRWPLAARVAASTAVPVLFGWAFGSIDAGLVATLGIFTADYGTDRPYAKRGVQSAVIAVALAATVTVGMWASAVAWIAVLAVSAVAVVAVWICSALATGPPGAYMFVLVCAAGIGVSAAHLPPWQVGLLVLAGGAVAWVGGMAGALTDRRGPEKEALAAAGDAVASYLKVAGTPEAVGPRRRAAESLARSWIALIDYQPARDRSAAQLVALREANHSLHVIFADGMAAVRRGEAIPDDAADSARAIGTLTANPAIVANRDPRRPPLPPVAIPVRLSGAIRRGSHDRRVMARVAVATPVTGAVTAALGVGHAYWAMAAAVLVLHQGSHLAATLQRGTERVVGTLVGLCFSALVLAAHPQGLWIVAIVVGLQFGIQMYIIGNYAVATVFITAIALTISTGTRRVDVGTLLVDRGLDTVIGCGVGTAVFLLMARRQEARRLTEAIAGVIEHTIRATEFIVSDDVSSLPARDARRTLQDSIFDLDKAQEAARHGSRRDQSAAIRLGSVIVAAEELGFATVAACWKAEQHMPELFGSAEYLKRLHVLAQGVRTGTTSPAREEPSVLCSPEVLALEQAWRTLPPVY